VSDLAEVTVELRAGATVARIIGEIDLSNVDEIRDVLVDAVEHEVVGLVLDLSETTYLDSTGIRLLFELAQRMQTRRRNLRLVVTDQALVRRVIVLTQLEERVPIDADVAESLAALENADHA
jgi:anti-sigma B factor antagonist